MVSKKKLEKKNVKLKKQNQQLKEENHELRGQLNVLSNNLYGLLSFNAVNNSDSVYHKRTDNVPSLADAGLNINLQGNPTKLLSVQANMSKCQSRYNESYGARLGRWSEHKEEVENQIEANVFTKQEVLFDSILNIVEKHIKQSILRRDVVRYVVAYANGNLSEEDLKKELHLSLTNGGFVADHSTKVVESILVEVGRALIKLNSNTSLTDKSAHQRYHANNFIQQSEQAVTSGGGTNEAEHEKFLKSAFPNAKISYLHDEIQISLPKTEPLSIEELFGNGELKINNRHNFSPLIIDYMHSVKSEKPYAKAKSIMKGLMEKLKEVESREEKEQTPPETNKENYLLVNPDGTTLKLTVLKRRKK